MRCAIRRCDDENNVSSRRSDQLKSSKLYSKLTRNLNSAEQKPHGCPDQDAHQLSNAAAHPDSQQLSDTDAVRRPLAAARFLSDADPYQPAHARAHPDTDQGAVRAPHQQ